MILVDTSAWIEFFRGHSRFADRVDMLLEDNAIAICGPVLSELRAGLRSVAERRRVIPLFGGCRLLGQPRDLWESAGDLGFVLRRKGVTAKTVNLFIATYALDSGLAILTADAGFAAMQRAGIPIALDTAH